MAEEEVRRARAGLAASEPAPAETTGRRARDRWEGAMDRGLRRVDADSGARVLAQRVVVISTARPSRKPTQTRAK